MVRVLVHTEAMVANGTLTIGDLQRAALRVLTNRILLGELIDATEQNPWRNLTLEREVQLAQHFLI